MSEGVVRTLTAVRHVPTMTINLVSLNTLDRKGYKYSAEGGVMEVTKDSLVVMKGYLLAVNLYLLQASTVIGNPIDMITRQFPASKFEQCSRLIGVII